MSLKPSVLTLIALAAVPFAAQAQPSAETALDACVKSFVATYLPGHPVRQVSKRAPAPGFIESYYAPRQYTIALTAYGARSGNLLAQARCVANRSGSVIVLDSPPAGEYVARADFAVSLR